MTDFVTALTQTVTVNALWGALTPAAAIVAIGVIVGFGYFVIRRAIRGIGHGRGGI